STKLGDRTEWFAAVTGHSRFITRGGIGNQPSVLRIRLASISLPQQIFPVHQHLRLSTSRREPWWATSSTAWSLRLHSRLHSRFTAGRIRILACHQPVATLLSRCTIFWR